MSCPNKEYDHVQIKEFGMSLLMTLYIKALALPNIEPETIESVYKPNTEPYQVGIDRQVPSIYWMLYDSLALTVFRFPSYYKACAVLKNDSRG